MSDKGTFLVWLRKEILIFVFTDIEPLVIKVHSPKIIIKFFDRASCSDTVDHEHDQHNIVLN
jgi:hypothetical protein